MPSLTIVNESHGNSGTIGSSSSHRYRHQDDDSGVTTKSSSRPSSSFSPMEGNSSLNDTKTTSQYKRKRRSLSADSSSSLFPPKESDENEDDDDDSVSIAVQQKSLMDDDDEDVDIEKEAVAAVDDKDEKQKRADRTHSKTKTNGTSTGTTNRQLDTDVPTTKKQRQTPTTTMVASSWQEFYRQGNRFKALLDEALTKVATATTTTTTAVTKNRPSSSDFFKDTSNQDNNDNDHPSSLFMTSTSLLQKLANDKQTKNLLLQQQLQQQKLENVTLQALLDDLRSTKEKQSMDIARLSKALKLAAHNATKAREDADNAESTAAALSDKIEALETVIQESKRASQQIMDEQDQDRQRLLRMESEFIKSQAHLARSIADKQKMDLQHRGLKKQLDQVNDLILHLSQDLEHEREESLRWKRDAQEHQQTGHNQRDRLERLEIELQQSKTLLVEATSVASESQLANQQLQQSLTRMEEANQQLNDKLQNYQEKLQRQEQMHNETLAQAQKDHQVTQHKWNHDRDLVQNLKIENQAANKKLTQLQSKLAQAERRILESTSLTTSIKAQDENMATTPNDREQLDPSTVAPENLDFKMVIPSLAGSNQQNSSNKLLCSICFKEILGGLKAKCQCGKQTCKLRAHNSCVAKINVQHNSTSVSHPGTPAFRLPLVLCGKNACTMATTTSNIRRAISTGEPPRDGSNTTTPTAAVTPANSNTEWFRIEDRASL